MFLNIPKHFPFHRRKSETEQNDMNDNAKVMNATVRLYCCGNRCERFLDINIKECCDAEDLLDEARQEAEITHQWFAGLYCEDHHDKSEPCDDFDNGDFDPYSARV